MTAVYRILRYWLLLGLGLFVLGAEARQMPPAAGSLPAGVAEYRVEAWRDPTGAVTLAELLQSPREFANLPTHGLSAGYSTDAWWLRIMVRKVPQADSEWRVLIDTPHLDDVRMFIPQRGGQLTSFSDYLDYRMGDRTPMSARPLAFNAPLAGVVIADTEPRWIYIRIQTSGSLVAFPELLTRQTFAEQAQYKLMGMFLFFGVLLAMLMISIFYASWLRDKSIATFCLLLTAQIIGHGSVEGYFGQLLVPEYPLIADRMVGFSGNIGYALGTLLFTHMTSLRSHFPRLYPFQIAASAYFAVVAIGSLTPFYSALAQAGRVLLIPVALFILASAIQDTRHKRVGAIYFALGYAVLVTLIAYSSLRLLGIVSGHGNPFTSQTFAVLAEIVLLQIGIAARAHQAQKERQDSAFRWQRAMEHAEHERDLRETQGQFLNMVAHEVRTPLAVISAAGATLRLVSDPSNPIVGERIDRIESSVQRMERLFELCLNADRIEKEKTNPERHPTQVANLIRELPQLGPALAERLVINDSSADMTIQADRRLLSVALSNLIDNAVKFAPAGSPITIDIARTDQPGQEGLTIRVSDQGPGIPDALCERIFDKHFRASEQNNTPGLGLGLYLTRRIINNHNGSIVAVPGPGGKFSIFLPVA